MQRYSYATGQLLDKPNTYFYSQYGGIEFLKAWRKARGKIIHALGKPMLPPTAEVAKSFEDVVEKVHRRGETINTHEMLEVVYHTLEISRESGDKKIEMLVDELVKKFEVSKRWYRSYRAHLRVAVEDKNDGSAYRDIGLYMRAAEIFEIAYSKIDKLPYLNVFLKSLDTLCALCDDLTNEQKGRLARLLMKERDYIDSLAKFKGLSI